MIEKVGGNIEGPALNNDRQLCLSMEKKMRFSKGETILTPSDYQPSYTNNYSL